MKLSKAQINALRKLGDTGWSGAHYNTLVALLDRKLVTTKHISPELFTENHSGDPMWMLTDAGREVLVRLGR